MREKSTYLGSLNIQGGASSMWWEYSAPPLIRIWLIDLPKFVCGVGIALSPDHTGSYGLELYYKAELAQVSRYFFPARISKKIKPEC